MRVWYLFILLAFVTCRKKYRPELDERDMSILVVEGNIDPGEDSTIIRITRTLNVNDTGKIKAENNAQVVVEGRDNTKYPLIRKGNGYYVFPGLHLNIGNDYRLRVITTSGEEYLSDYVQARRSPDIDSVTWALDTVGLHFYVHTHQNGNDPKFYRWDCVEAWMIRMPFYAEVIYENGIIRPSVWPQDNMWECYRYDSTNSLLLGNSRGLSDGRISYKEVKTIPYHHEKAHWEYGILVKQYAIDEAADKFFSLMKKNTEGIGNLFSPQPFELKGNIRSVKDTSRYALGYVTSSTISKKTTKVSGVNLIYWRSNPFKICDSVTTVKNTIADFRFYFDQLGYMPFKPVYDFNGNLTGYSSAKPICVDCRVLGATSTKPYFF
jgi:hypothetical protein